MASFQTKDLVTILKRTLNLLNYRIVDHSERVAFLVLQMLACSGHEKCLDEIPTESVFLISFLHDIGAFKTEDIDLLLDSRLAFDSHTTKHHAIYGYLFLQLFGVGRDVVKSVLYHHTDYQELKVKCPDTRYAKLAAWIFAADRLDLLLHDGSFESAVKQLNYYRGIVFDPEAIDLLVEAERRFHIGEQLESGDYQDWLLNYYGTMQMNERQTVDMLRAIAYLIDFRSEYTVTHTVNTVTISAQIARLMGFDQHQLNDVFFGALLHDIGKIAISPSILEKSEKLDDFEYRIMKEHVEVSEQILTGCVSQEVLEIAVRHHEKLDGSGYPRGLEAEALTMGQRIVAVADILSALKNKRSYKEAFPKPLIMSIIHEQRGQGKLCPAVIGVVLEHYDSIMEGADEMSLNMLRNYEQIREEYLRLSASNLV